MTWPPHSEIQMGITSGRFIYNIRHWKSTHQSLLGKENCLILAVDEVNYVHGVCVHPKEVHLHRTHDTASAETIDDHNKATSQ